MTRRWAYLKSAVSVLLFAALVAGPAWAGHGRHESRPDNVRGCGGRVPETEASLRELVRLLTDRNGVLAIGDRLRCAVQTHPKLAIRLLTPLVASYNRDASLMAAKMLGEIGPEASGAVPRLIRMLHSSDPYSCVMGAQALSNMGSAAADAVPALIALLEDENPEVRRAATGALAHLGPSAGAAAIPLAMRVGDPVPCVRMRRGRSATLARSPNPRGADSRRLPTTRMNVGRFVQRRAQRFPA